MTRRAISLRLATSSFWITESPSHPEHAVATRAVDGGVVDDREAHAEDVARVAGVDDAVVVEAAGEKQGQRLALDLALDHGSHLGVGFLVEVLAPRGGALAGHDRQHP